MAAEELAPYLPAESAIVHVLSPERFGDFERPAAGPSLPLLGRAPARAGEVDVALSDPGVAFDARRNGLELASPQQIYVDLARDRGRGRDAAEHLRRHALGF